MDGFDEIEEIPDEVWEKMTEEQKEAYERRVFSDENYDKALSDTGPTSVFIFGCIVGFFGIVEISLGALGAFMCMLAVLWEIIRVIDRGHRYQKVKDASEEYKRVMNQKKE